MRHGRVRRAYIRHRGPADRHPRLRHAAELTQDAVLAASVEPGRARRRQVPGRGPSHDGAAITGGDDLIRPGLAGDKIGRTVNMVRSGSRLLLPLVRRNARADRRAGSLLTGLSRGTAGQSEAALRRFHGVERARAEHHQPSQPNSAVRPRHPSTNAPMPSERGERRLVAQPRPRRGTSAATGPSTTNSTRERDTRPPPGRASDPLRLPLHTMGTPAPRTRARGRD